jgi:hypothetical protein
VIDLADWRSSMKSLTALLLLACLGLAGTAACAAEDRKPLPPERAAAVREALQAWFECVECNQGELDQVIRYRGDAEDALIHTLQQGPSRAKRAEIEARLGAQFDANVAANNWKPEEKGQYVETYRSKAELAYRLRAIKALARIGTDGARRALAEAAHDSSPQVSAAAKKALGSLPPP